MLPVVVAVVAAVLVVGLAVLVPLAVSADHDAVARGDGDRAAPSGPTVDTSNLSAVEEYDDLAVDHLPAGVSVDYPQSPPVGGRHAPVWLECGVYDEPVPEANMVHSLEHGTVWITYRDDDLDAAEIAALAGQLPQDGILSPYPDQEASVVITVWGRQLELTGSDDPRISLFIGEYGAGDTAPEPLASCHGGVRPDDVGDTTRIA
ncbi:MULTISPECIES: DUF3105 domain-containing protein [Nocardioides]|nr:DUF3105 domain-containing protein [Nocardioides sp.]THJ01633.1 DUF3105 domain-containing protein [Nocardioides sp.]